ncbi:unnamed protein product, partial [Ectocarpus sp. 13 AM-2016]
WLSSSRCDRHVLQRRCQATKTQPRWHKLGGGGYWLVLRLCSSRKRSRMERVVRGCGIAIQLAGCSSVAVLFGVIAMVARRIDPPPPPPRTSNYRVGHVSGGEVPRHQF